MSIAFVAASNAAGLSSLSRTIPVPAGTLDGHVMIAVVTVRTGNLVDNAITPPAGWQVVHEAYDAGSPGVRTGVYVRVANAEPADYTWTFQTSNESCGSILTYSGVNTSAPIHAQAADVQATASTTRTTPAINVTDPDSWVISWFADRSGSDWTGPDTERSEVKVPATSASQVVCDSAGPVAPGSVSRTATATVSTSVAEQGIIALAPAASPTMSVVDQRTGTGSRDDISVASPATEDNWLIATIAYRCADGTRPLATIADLARNYWQLCGTSSSTDGAWRVEVWACPRVRYAPWAMNIVYAAVSHIHATDTGSVVLHVAEVAGFANGFPTVEAVTVGTATSATTLTLQPPATGEPAFTIAAAAVDNASATVTVGTGWTALSQVARSGPDLLLAPAWRSPDAGAVTWTSSAAVTWVGIVVSLRETGVPWPQDNPNWPATRLQLGRGAGLATPLPRVQWSDETGRFEAIRGKRGLQYELARPQAGETTLTLRNFDDGLTPAPGGDVDLYVPYQLLMAWDGKIYPVSSGWIERFTRSWLTPHHGYVDAQATDAIAMLVNDVPSPMRGEILRHYPYAYWPLDDPSGSARATNASTRSTAPLTVAVSKYGKGSGNTTFGATLDISGDEGATGWQQSDLVTGDTKKGACLLGRDDGFPRISGGITIFGITLYGGLTPQPSTDMTVVILRSRNSRNGTLIKVAISPTLGAPKVTVWDKDTATPTTTTGQFNMAQPRPLPWALRFTRTTWTFAHTNYTTTMSGTCDLPDTWYAISIGGEADEWWAGNCGNATHAHVAVFDRWLTDGEVDQLMGGAYSGWFSQENTHHRLQRVLATSGTHLPRALDGSNVRMSRDGRGGVLAQRLADVAEYENGLIFGDAAGHLRFRSNSRTYRQFPRWTLGDDVAAGEIPFELGAAPEYDPTYLANEVTVENSGEDTLYYTSTATTRFLTEAWLDKTHTAGDAAAGDRYGRRPLTREVRMYDAAAAQGIADWLAALGQTPAQRFTSVRVDAARYPQAWPLVLGIEVGDLVTVVRRPVGQAPVTAVCRVMEVAHDISYGRGETRGVVTLTLAAAPPSVLICGDPVKGVLGDNTLGWW